MMEKKDGYSGVNTGQKFSLVKYRWKVTLEKKGITGFRVPLHSPIYSLSLLFSPTKFSTNKIFPTSKKKKKRCGVWKKYLC
jgi:hypothetical protein